MIVKSGQTIQDTQTSGTYNGIWLQIYLLASIVNKAILRSDFSPAGINIKVVLKRKSGSTVMMQDNLQILGHYCSLKMAQNLFLDGFDKVYATASKKAIKLRSVFLDFGGHVKINSGDQLLVEVSCAAVGTLSSNIDKDASFIEFWAASSIGYEEYIPVTVANVVQASTTKQQFNPGDNITKCAILNFDQDNIETEIVSNISLQSDRYDVSMSFNQLLAHSRSFYGQTENARYGISLPIDASGLTVVRGLDSYPQTLVLFDGQNDKKELDQCRLDIAFNSGNVAASQNFVVWTQNIEDLQTLLAAAKIEQKHNDEKLQKVSAS
ncbi:MAG: hypothetical protein ABI295_02345 [Xanthomarina sp.]